MGSTPAYVTFFSATWTNKSGLNAEVCVATEIMGSTLQLPVLELKKFGYEKSIGREQGDFGPPRPSPWIRV
jgi:hypothetical protein